ncbi:aryl-alcohol dehydrogenase [Dendrothele bispora CBS 962.96]|uniref:Aryl-alcohol dehydrogenase n=1 Tax=Dendrothele bispora (strain CBS 962.96) TaxID=1314807 RepID=A0A4S8L0T2_DENBC|nr:aryl-alcohol dehydrogenase [Dendrothele bispora CBS 962.96]
MSTTTTTNGRKMQYVRLGKSGLKVSRIILGCMSYGSPTWYPWFLSEEEGIKHIKAAYDAGVNTFDTADVYSNGLSEVILGKAIKQLDLPRESIVVMTKFGGVVDPTPNYAGPMYRNFGNADNDGYVNQWGGSRKHIFEAVKKSLARLQLDYIDVLQYHRLDPLTPIEETMQALHDVVKAGYVRYIGMSSCYAWQFHVMQNYAISNNLTPFISMQDHHSLIYREEEREMFPTLKHFGVGAIPWSPLARGMLCRPFGEQTHRGNTDGFSQAYVRESTKKIIDRVEEVAKKKGVSMAQIALAWSLNKNPICAPTIGTTSIENAYIFAGAIDIQLTNEEIKYLEEPYEPVQIIGH